MIKLYTKSKIGRVFIGRFETGDDLLVSLADFCKKKKIFCGVFNIIGAVKNAKIGYYNQDKKLYNKSIELNKKLEIASCIGNISILDKKIFPHTHITFSDVNGKAYGGHLMSGTIVFAAEFIIFELKNKKLIRKKHQITGLNLW